MEFEFTINAASSLVPCLCPGWATSGPRTSTAFSHAKIQTFSFISLGVADLLVSIKPWEYSIIHSSSRTIGWQLTYQPPGLLITMYSHSFQRALLRYGLPARLFPGSPLLWSWDAHTLQIFRLHSSPSTSVDTPRQYLQNSSHHECLEGLQAPDRSLPRVSVLSTHGRPLSLSSNCSLLLFFFLDDLPCLFLFTIQKHCLKDSPMPSWVSQVPF